LLAKQEKSQSDNRKRREPEEIKKKHGSRSRALKKWMMRFKPNIPSVGSRVMMNSNNRNWQSRDDVGARRRREWQRTVTGRRRKPAVPL